MARPKKYRSRGGLEKAVDKYFDSISRLEDVTELFGTGQFYPNGAEVMERRPVCNGAGAALQRLEYIEPPRMAELCRFLGISRTTWNKYYADEEFGDVVEMARLRLESYWEGLLQSKYHQGARTALEHHYGWSKPVEIELTASDDTKIERLSFDQKMALIAQAAQAMEADGVELGGDDDGEEKE